MKFAEGIFRNFFEMSSFFKKNGREIKGTQATSLLWKDKTQPRLKIVSITADEKQEHLVGRMHLSGDTFEKVPKAFRISSPYQYDDTPEKLEQKTDKSLTFFIMFLV